MERVLCVYLGPVRAAPWDKQYDNGWGKQGSRSDGVHFQRAIQHSAKFIQQAALQLVPAVPWPCAFSTHTLRDTLVRWTAHYQAHRRHGETEHAPLDGAVIPNYIQLYERAAIEHEEFTEREYKQTMKYAVMILKG